MKSCCIRKALDDRAMDMAARTRKYHMYMWKGKWWWMSPPQDHGQQYRSRVQLRDWFIR